jgi:hypothetical protein
MYSAQRGDLRGFRFLTDDEAEKEILPDTYPDEVIRRYGSRES